MFTKQLDGRRRKANLPILKALVFVLRADSYRPQFFENRRFLIVLGKSEYTLKVFNILDLIETLFGTTHLEQIAVIYEEIML